MESSPTFPCAHASIEIRYEEGRGRYAVAAKDIPLGTTLVKEQPITFALHPVIALISGCCCWNIDYIYTILDLLTLKFKFKKFRFGKLYI